MGGPNDRYEERAERKQMSNEQLCKDYVDMVTKLLSKPNLHGIELDAESQDNNGGPIGMYNRRIQAITTDLNLVHLALCIAGEALELSIATDEVNVLEELGDICFYTVGAAIQLKPIICAQLGMPQTGAEWLRTCIEGFAVDHKSFNALFVQCDKAADYIKKKVFYQQKQLKNEMVSIEVSIAARLYDILTAINNIKPLPEVMQTNMQKLGTRYQSGKFSTEEATARKDKEIEQSN